MSNVKLYGNDSSNKESSLYIDIVKCSEEDGELCETDDTKIRDYFSGLSMQVLKNQILFDQARYGEEAILM